MVTLYQRIFEEPIRPDASSAIAVVDVAKDGRQVSYAQLKRLVDNNRSTIPIKAGEKVALVMPNSLELIVGLLATWAQGGATVPLNPAYTSSEFRVCSSIDNFRHSKTSNLPFSRISSKTLMLTQP